MKSCSKCKLEKDEAQFTKNRNVCLICTKEQRQLYRQNNPEKVREREKLYRQNNLEKVRERERLYSHNNLEKARERNRLYCHNNREKKMLYGARARSKQKDLPFNIEEIDIMIPTICPVLGIPISPGEGKPRPNSPSLDRIIPEKGYVKGNIVVISSKANTIKSDATPEEIIMVGEFYKKLIEEASKNE